MLIDATQVFEPKGTSLATVSAAGTSTNILDLGGPAIPGHQGRDLGIGPNGNGPYMIVALNGVTVSDTLTSLQFHLQGAVDTGTGSNSGTPGTFVDYLLSPKYNSVTLAQTGGEQYFFPIVLPPRPPGVAPPRYLQLAYSLTTTGTSAVGSITAGTVFAALAIGRDDQVAYVENFTPPPTVGAGT